MLKKCYTFIGTGLFFQKTEICVSLGFVILLSQLNFQHIFAVTAERFSNIFGFLAVRRDRTEVRLTLSAVNWGLVQKQCQACECFVLSFWCEKCAVRDSGFVFYYRLYISGFLLAGWDLRFFCFERWIWENFGFLGGCLFRRRNGDSGLARVIERKRGCSSVV